MITVLHLDYDAAGMSREERLQVCCDGKLEAVKHAFKQGYYRSVAEVNAEKLEEAFQYTNNIETQWRFNPQVICPAGEGKRSTSVGDILIADGIHFMVDKYGFSPVDL